MFFIPVILSRLPSDFRMEWARDGEGHEKDLNFLMTFLRKEIERRERSDAFSDLNEKKHEKSSEKKIKMVSPTVSALQSTSERQCCAFCGKNHLTEKCWEFLRLPVL